MDSDQDPSARSRRQRIYRIGAFAGVVVVVGLGYSVYVRSRSEARRSVFVDTPDLADLGLADVLRPKVPRRPSLTAERVQRVLDQNDGASDSTHFKGTNSETYWTYKVEDGVLRIRESGKTSWADSRYINEYDGSVEQARAFIRRNEQRLNMEDIYV